MTKLKKNAGVMLAELIIYIVLGLIVASYAFKAMTDMAKGYTRSRTVIKMQKDGRDAVQVMAREIANTGFKYYIHDTTENITNGTVTTKQTFYTTRPGRSPVFITTNTNTNTKMYIPSQENWLNATYCGARNFPAGAPPDSTASFQFRNNIGNGDSLTIFFAQLHPQGNRLTSIHKVSYYLNNNNLMRIDIVANPAQLNSSAALDSTATWNDPAVPMAIMDKVAALQFLFSTNGLTWTSSPAGIRHTIKMIKIQVVVYSDKSQKENYTKSIKVGGEIDLNGALSGSIEITSTTAVTGQKRLLRLYEKVVDIPNNGVLIN